MNFEIFLKSKVLCVTDKWILSFRKGKLLLYNSQKELINQVCLEGIRHNGLLQRLLRLEPRLAVPLDDNSFLVSYNGKMLRYDITLNQLHTEQVYEKRMKNPLSICLIENETYGKEFYYGEYIWNEEKGPVSVFRRRNGAWDKVYTFSAGAITHIHNIIYCQEKKCFYILTGDEDKESGIWVADYTFETVRQLVGGMQQFRACIAFLEEDYLYYATDTPLEQNFLYRIHLLDNRLEKLGNINGSCIYGAVQGDLKLFSTTVEPDSSLPKWRYKFTRKLGKGIIDRYSHLYMIDCNKKPKELLALRKDRLPMWLFQFGTITFPYNTTNDIFITTQAVKPKYGITLKIKSECKETANEI